jgi:preprotein translocase subunit SecA
VLNAKQHTREAEIVAQAGRLHQVTVATNMAGRGVDILLGGNPEILARLDLRADDAELDLDSEEGRAQLEALEATYAVETKAEGEKVREVGGLYVLGTERHDSRRIDNQLRGRAGRQGDPGESRFYISLEDDLMRLFATGAMNWVMDRAFPDDMPLEARMVTKAIERAQRTVEDRNFEIRKDVLKYDEVMNEQRKVIYQRRQQILDGEDLGEASREAIEDAVEHLIETYCPGEYPEQWDLDEFHQNLTQTMPTDITRERLDDAKHVDELRGLVVDDALERYDAKEQAIGAETLREIERRVMLSVIDQHWREHLYEMDYLREGINLRAMGQRDPLAEWQREGFDMFEAMMGMIDDDFVRYVTHLEVVTEEEEAPQPRNLSYSAPEDPVQGAAALQQARAAQPVEEALEDLGDAPEPVGPIGAANEPVSVEKTPGRNEPCYCGSGKKYKLCHGR